jgi:hypothetical protein
VKLIDQARSVLEMASGVYAGAPEADVVAEHLARLDEPLRVAVAGKVKAGKSTLLNALVGEELAPTDEGECTRIVTWYRNGITYRVTLHGRDGSARQAPFGRDAGAIEVDLGDTDAADVERLEVEWPSRALEGITLIDTPGIGSLSEDVSARTVSFLSPGDELVTPADAVLYLMRHLHATDLDFLETFHDQEAAQPTPVNAIGVLSRADEVAVGRLDAMESAARIAARYRRDPKVRRLVQTVVPVAGLLAQSGTTLREAEFAALSAFAAEPATTTDALFLSADRFVNADAPFALTTMEREHLLDRLGLFGVKLATQVLRTGQASTANQLANELVRRSGLVELRETLLSQFAGRRDLLKARTALLAVDGLAHASPVAGADKLLSEVERVTAGAHELAELRLLNAVRSGSVEAGAAVLEEMEVLLGASGTADAVRLGVPATAGPDEIRVAASTCMATWQRRAENPMSSSSLADASRLLVRTCEGILSTLP